MYIPFFSGFIRPCLLLGTAGAFYGFLGCNTQIDTKPKPPATPSQTKQVTPIEWSGAVFSDIAAEAGLDFVHFNGMTGGYHLPEIVGSGAALFDHDNDGDLDLYLVQGTMLESGKSLAEAIFPPSEALTLTDRLYRNDLAQTADNKTDLHFTDVTAVSGIEADGYGMGAATGDYNNDGWVDLYVTNFRANQLWHNNGDGTFKDMAVKAGVGDDRWSVSASFADIDQDGWLDLYVGNYVQYNFAALRPCFGPGGGLDYCGPIAFAPEVNRLFHNQGDGTFKDISNQSTIGQTAGSTLGVSIADFNGDGRIDIYAANDGRPNELWLNRGSGRFDNDALLGGTAVNIEGQAEASMGVDAADADGDGDEDLFMTHLTQETNTLYLNDGQGLFQDRSQPSGLGQASWEYTGFGTAFVDFDNDSWQDVLVVNGAVKIIERLAREGDIYPLDQTNQLFHNLGKGKFIEISQQAGQVFSRAAVSRGAAFGDIDNDGDTDVVINNNSGPVRLWRNEVGHANHWLGLKLERKEGKGDLPGTRIEVIRPGRTSLWRRLRTDGSYASANDPRILVGLGDKPALEKIRVYWPGGSAEDWSNVAVGRYQTLRQGTGKAVP